MSAPIKFYYDLLSQPSRALYIFLKQTKIPVDEHPIALRKGVHLTDEYRDTVNRFKKVPAIVDNSFQLSESIAIFRYLTSQYEVDDQWYPKNNHVRARIDEYLEWQHYHTRQTCAQYWMLKYMKPRTIGPSPGDAQIVASAEAQMEKTLDMIENLWLRPGSFISGTNQISFADILAACEIEQPTMTGYDPTANRPNVGEWLKLVRQFTNPAYDEAHAILYKLKEQQQAKL
ncbi:glutathione S-transferase theta-1-like [Contarinia nasturtii]|uniref:glutathione S-transferase theta-1-like n=1 Tax=Contarinia nasturtii TaxID=265458 RepID=UPI0012D3976D|nr:glutathione S-transferase theta-1-like [Contarinia nasturtii]